MIREHTTDKCPTNDAARTHNINVLQMKRWYQNTQHKCPTNAEMIREHTT